MAAFEEALLQHRTALVKYLTEWSLQQDLMCARYANGDCQELTGMCMRSLEQGSCQYNSPQPPDSNVEGPLKIQNVIGTPEQTFVSMSRDSHSTTCPQVQRAPAPPVKDEVVLENPALDLVDHRLLLEAGTEARWATRPSRRLSVPKTFSTEGIKAAISHASTTKFQDEAKNVRSDFFAEVVEAPAFIYTLAFIICANVVFMAVATDIKLDSAKQGEQANEMIFGVVDALFTACYVIEIVLKIAAYGTCFFTGDEWRWNIFDMAVVISALVDFITPLFTSGGVNLTYLRMNRVLKLIKVMRVVKVYRTFKELRVIVASIMGCTKTLFWSIALITIVLFTFSLLFVQGVTDYLSVHPVGESDEDFLAYWGSTGRAMVSLFQAVTGGEDWAAVAQPLWELGWVYYGAFMIYICFFMFVVVNVLTGLFVDAALTASIKDDAMMIREEMNHKQEYVQLIQCLFCRLDSDGSGELTLREFEKGMNSAEMHAFASAIDIEISDIQEFFKLVSAGGPDVVDIEKFVVGCMKLKGSAKSLDLVSLLHRTKMLEHQVTKFIGRADQRFKEQQTLLRRVLQEQGLREPTPFLRAELC